MISVEQALEFVLRHARPITRSIQTELSHALGCTLAEDIASDIDSPPYDKTQVDGYAICEADLANRKPLRVLERVVAGEVPQHKLTPGTAIQIMTGAPIPEGCAAVVMVEKTEASENGAAVTILDERVRNGMSIMRRATSMKRGEVVLTKGTKLRAIEIGLLAEVGRSLVWTMLDPAVAILPTGDEIVPCDEVPTAGKIRNSNSSLLGGLVTQAGGYPTECDIVRDEPEALLAAIRENLEHDVILLSGGVSAGVHDLVPAALAQAGVKQIFHKVNLKPGKPLWFGFFDRGEFLPPCLVFGLPGNPVSGLVCFELFVRPALQKLRGEPAVGLEQRTATLAQDHPHRGDRPAYWPSQFDATTSEVKPLAWQGSGDLRALARANALAHFPGGDKIWSPGEEVNVYLLPH
ncbi:molybdopterin molybdotransferase MoeA [Anatilimnocola floriformis]|uniref:molybdopterin molybdotransferase MoeA n=1 Tax=Anatilimnocola floriformis TaxID=2948575 RepID=UPI0020C3453F|nr:gephyrin-like molybdotransferase Glp [Anatilimnocola floriformis]